MSKLLWLIVGAGLLWCSMLMSNVARSQSIDWEAEEMTVREWLHQQQQVQRTEAEFTSESPVRIELMAIYGVGKHLMAEVRYRGEPFMYLRGQVWPMGHKASPQLYRLLGLSASCIRLQHGDEPEQTHCLLSTLGEP